MATQSDALVFFGATGDLAYKDIFPALQGMIRHGHPEIPIIGVAKSGRSLDEFRARAKDSLEKHGGVDTEAFKKLCRQLQYLHGDYRDPEIYNGIRQALGQASRPLHYLAIPPSLFGTVAAGLAKAGMAQDARVVVEKPFGRDLPSARELNKTLSQYFPENSIFRIDHYLGKKRFRICCISDSQILFRKRSGTATIFAACKSPWRRSSGWARADVCTRSWARFATWFRTICSRC